MILRKSIVTVIRFIRKMSFRHMVTFLLRTCQGRKHHASFCEGCQNNGDDDHVSPLMDVFLFFFLTPCPLLWLTGTQKQSNNLEICYLVFLNIET